VKNLRNHINSRPEPLVHLYNRVADALPANLDACVAAAAVQPAGTVRVTAAHEYGTVDIGIAAGANWVTFTIVNSSAWHADPLSAPSRGG
jgi:hypothetical protein